MPEQVSPVLACQGLSLAFGDGSCERLVIDQVNLALRSGASLAISGASGSGKSALLHVLAGLDTPSAGAVFWSGVDVSGLSAARLSRLRNRSVGVVYQFHHLLSDLDVLENVALPMLIAGRSPRHARAEAAALLERLGLAEYAQQSIGVLSGGQRQRVAIARAVIMRPRCILADEPTGNLDQGSAVAVSDLLLSLKKEFKCSLLVVTHEEDLANQMDDQVVLVDGKLQSR